ncbi:MAG: MoxR family ATPase [Treponema sp.]
MDTVQSGALQRIAAFKKRMAASIIGQEQLINDILIAYIAGGHVLLEGAPGLAKTLTVRSFAELSHLSFKRIQFTPDLLPADLTGTLIFDPTAHRFSVRKGPLFAHIVLADEINRAPAKVQSALLEAMAEGQVTIGENSYPLPEPFFVLATQNPIEQEGTYPLPEAELDRFLFKLFVPYPKPADEITIMLNSAHIAVPAKKPSENTAEPILPIEVLRVIRNAADRMRCAQELQEYIVSLVAATRPIAEKSAQIHHGSYLSYITAGASPRASIALYRCSKIRAFLNGREYVTPDDVKAIAYPVLRHRLKLSYEAAAENVSADEIITKLLEIIPQP